MISSSYVNGSIVDIPAYDPFNLFESEIDTIMDTVNTAYLEYKAAIDEYNLSVEFFEASDDAKKDNVSGAKTNFVDKLGSAIIEVGKKALAFINNIISKIQDSLFGNKSDMAKVSALCKKNPDMADDINKAFREGKLQVADLKNIKELEDAYDEIMRLAKQENVDPNTLRGKWAAAKKKFGNLSESDIIKGATTAVGVAAAGTGLVLSIGKLPEAIYNIKHFKEVMKDKTELAELTLSKARDSAEEAKIKLDTAKKSAALSDETNKYKLSEAKYKEAKAKDEAETASMNKGITASKVVKSIADNLKGTPTSESVDIDISVDGYMTESASAAVAGVIQQVHSDMMRVLTALGGFNFKTLSKAQAIINAAIKGYNKPIKGQDKETSEE